MNRDREQALIRALNLETGRSPRRRGSVWIAFLLGMIVMFFVMGIVPYWRLLLQVWNGCVA